MSCKKQSCMEFFNKHILITIWIWTPPSNIPTSQPSFATSKHPGARGPHPTYTITPQKSNELIPKIAIVKGSYLFQTIILGIQLLVFGGVVSGFVDQPFNNFHRFQVHPCYFPALSFVSSTSLVKFTKNETAVFEEWENMGVSKNQGYSKMDGL